MKIKNIAIFSFFGLCIFEASNLIFSNEHLYSEFSQWILFIIGIAGCLFIAYLGIFSTTYITSNHIDEENLKILSDLNDKKIANIDDVMTIGTSVITVIQNLTNEKAQKSNIPFEAKVYIVDNSNKELISELESVLTKYK